MPSAITAMSAAERAADCINPVTAGPAAPEASLLRDVLFSTSLLPDHLGQFRKSIMYGKAPSSGTG